VSEKTLTPDTRHLFPIMANKINLEVITPEKLVLRESVDELVLPGLTGEIGVLPDHEPLISQLKTGILSYRVGGALQKLHVSGGFAEVLAEKVSVLADVAEKPEDIDLQNAKADLERAEKSLIGSEGADLIRAELEVDRAKTRIQIAG
jgi:F-type H+-transporting ATPase subunit epsilon